MRSVVEVYIPIGEGKTTNRGIVLARRGPAQEKGAPFDLDHIWVQFSNNFLQFSAVLDILGRIHKRGLFPILQRGGHHVSAERYGVLILLVLVSPSPQT